MELPRNLISTPEMSRSEKAAVQALRRATLTEFAKRSLVAKGYQLGSSLGVPGAHGFHAIYQGRTVRIGIKTAADRWMSIPRSDAGEFGLLQKIDELFVVVFDDWADIKGLELWQFDPVTIIEMAKRSYGVAERLGQKGLQFLPFDNTDRRPDPASAAGLLKDAGTLLIEEPIDWIDPSDEDPQEQEELISPVSTQPDGNSAASPVRPLSFAEAKAGLAATLNMSVDQIIITISER